MKATIVRPDGTRIEVEGTPEEIAKLAPATVFIAPPNVVCSCYTAWPCPLHAFRHPGVVYGSFYGSPTPVALPDISPRDPVGMAFS